MKRALALALAAWLGLPHVARADDDEPHWNADTTLRVLWTDNVRWAPTGPQRDDATVLALNGAFGFERELPGLRPDAYGLRVLGRAFVDFSERDFVEITSWGEWDLGRTALELHYTYTPRKLGKEIDDAGDRSFFSRHQIGSGGTLRFGPQRRGRLTLRADGDWEIYGGANDLRDSLSTHGTVDVRYRVVHWFVPELRGVYGRRMANSDNLDRSEAEVRAGATFRPHRRVAVRTLYTFNARDYRVGSERGPEGKNKNFRRDDKIDEYQVQVRWRPPAIRDTAVALSWHLRDGTSDRESRVFDVTEVSLSATREF